MDSYDNSVQKAATVGTTALTTGLLCAAFGPIGLLCGLSTMAALSRPTRTVKKKPDQAPNSTIGKSNEYQTKYLSPPDRLYRSTSIKGTPIKKPESPTYELKGKIYEY